MRAISRLVRAGTRSQLVLVAHHHRLPFEHIAEHTVQDHLKSIFDKTGVRSRRELVATVFRQRYLPRTKSGDPGGPSGYFAEPIKGS